jgi:hypothetical protein
LMMLSIIQHLGKDTQELNGVVVKLRTGMVSYTHQAIL